MDRRRARRVPGIDEDPAWIIREDSGDPLRRRVAEMICALGAAGFGTRGSVEEPAAGATPLMVADGIYRNHGADDLLPGPLWAGLLITQVQPGSLEPNLDFYGPRTAHGSSLSPAVTAALLARAGRADEALAMLGLALTLDIGDTTGMTAAGLHIANLAGVWQAMLSGFAGVAVHEGVLTIDPQCTRSECAAESAVRRRCPTRPMHLWRRGAVPPRREWPRR